MMNEILQFDLMPGKKSTKPSHFHHGQKMSVCLPCLLTFNCTGPQKSSRTIIELNMGTPKF